MSRTACPVCSQTWNCKDHSGCVCTVEKRAIDMMRHAVSHASRNYYCVEVNSADWSRWIGLELLGLARGGVRINECGYQYFYVTQTGLDYLKRIARLTRKSATHNAPTQPASVVLNCPDCGAQVFRVSSVIDGRPSWTEDDDVECCPGCGCLLYVFILRDHQGVPRYETRKCTGIGL